MEKYALSLLKNQLRKIASGTWPIPVLGKVQQLILVFPPLPLVRFISQHNKVPHLPYEDSHSCFGTQSVALGDHQLTRRLSVNAHTHWHPLWEFLFSQPWIGPLAVTQAPILTQLDISRKERLERVKIGRPLECVSPAVIQMQDQKSLEQKIGLWGRGICVGRRCSRGKVQRARQLIAHMLG